MHAPQDSRVTDGMRRVIVVLCLAFLAGFLSGGRTSTVLAQPQSNTKVVAVSKTWGTFRGVYNDQLLFEDDHGTIRSVYPATGTVVFTITRR